MRVYLHFLVKSVVVHHRSRISLSKTETWLEVPLQLHSSVEKVFGVVYMRKEAIYFTAVLVNVLWKRFVELVVHKHKIEHAVVRDYGFLKHAYIVYNSGHAKRV